MIGEMQACSHGRLAFAAAPGYTQDIKSAWTTAGCDRVVHEVLSYNDCVLGIIAPIERLILTEGMRNLFWS